MVLFSDLHRIEIRDGKGGGRKCIASQEFGEDIKEGGEKPVSEEEEEGLPLPHLTRENSSSQTAEEEEEAKRRSVQQKCAV